MLPELKGALADAARRNGRSLNAEVVYRLERSFYEAAAPDIYPPVAAEPGATYRPCSPALTQYQEMMLDAFNGLPPEKQLALISLFK